ncbi:MAG: GNAT family N-acetyltransferase [Deltaproteobacteria bacterium]|nr:GNAT family N-acetyltransferase [Deltaproteobacteria bacterium]
MTDMLVRLYALPELSGYAENMEKIGVQVRRPNVWEKPLLLEWVNAHFSRSWALECETAFAVRPPSCFIAVKDDVLIGFACYDCTRLNFFGPTGVDDYARGKGVGTTLLLSCLYAMKDCGYAYAIIGGVGPARFYGKAVGAMAIEGSSPGIYDFSLIDKRRSGKI